MHFLSFQISLVTLQAKLGYSLIGILGEKCLRHFGYPHTCVIRILYHVLTQAGVKVLEENYLCTAECLGLEKSLHQDQLSCRLMKHRIRILHINVGKLLCVCVPEREKWREFGWIGKSVEEILDDLSL